MKKYRLLQLLSFAILLTAVFSSCVKDRLITTYTFFKPVYKTKTVVLQSIKSTNPLPLSNTGKIFTYGKYIFVNEVNKGVHIIDNTNPKAPVNSYFIEIPGNVDLAVKDNTLYADIYTDLVAIDISNPQQAQLKKMIPNVFPERQYSNGFIADSTQYIVDWKKEKTVTATDLPAPGLYSGGIYLDNSSYNQSSATPTSSVTKAGISGSMARFTVVGDYLYTAGLSNLSAINISSTNNPVIEKVQPLGWNIETIYPVNNKLFIGAQTGMFIFNITDPAAPTFAGSFSHACFRDPVIADDRYAYVTLRSMGEQGTCRGGLAAQTNELDIVDIGINAGSPSLVKVYNMAEPKGLSKDGIYLFICDGKEGLKLYNASNVQDLQLIKRISDINPSDVITQDKIALVVADEGIFQYDYSDISNVKLLSKIMVVNN